MLLQFYSCHVPSRYWASLRGGGDNPCSLTGSTSKPILECDPLSCSTSKLLPDLSSPRGSAHESECGRLSGVCVSGVNLASSSGHDDVGTSRHDSAGSSGMSRSSTRSLLARPRSSATRAAPLLCPLLSILVDTRFPLNLLSQVVLCASDVEPNFFDVNEVWKLCRIGRRIGMHWTMIVPATSDEYLRLWVS